MPHPHDDLLVRIAEMQNRIEELEAENIFMREKLDIPDSEYMKARVLGIPDWLISSMHLFMTKQVVTKHALRVIADDMDWTSADKFPSFAVHRLRKHLGPKGIHFETLWGVGYRIDLADQARLKSLIH